MTNHPFSKTLRRAALRVCLTLALAAFARPARADDPPRFSAPEVNDFVRKFAALTDDYVKAAKAKDEAKMKEIDARGKELESVDAAVEAKLKPEETEAFGKFLAAQAQKMIDAATATAP